MPSIWAWNQRSPATHSRPFVSAGKSAIGCQATSVSGSVMVDKRPERRLLRHSLQSIFSSTPDCVIAVPSLDVLTTSLPLQILPKYLGEVVRSYTCLVSLSLRHT